MADRGCFVRGRRCFLDSAILVRESKRADRRTTDFSAALQFKCHLRIYNYYRARFVFFFYWYEKKDVEGKKSDQSIGNSISSKKLFIRIVAGVWCLMCIILANSFSGQLTSFLTTPIYEPLVDSFEGIAESKTLNLVVEWKSVMGETFLVPPFSVFRNEAVSKLLIIDYISCRMQKLRRFSDWGTRFEPTLRTTRKLELIWKSVSTLIKLSILE